MCTISHFPKKIWIFFLDYSGVNFVIFELVQNIWKYHSQSVNAISKYMFLGIQSVSVFGCVSVNRFWVCKQFMYFDSTQILTLTLCNVSIQCMHFMLHMHVWFWKLLHISFWKCIGKNWWAVWYEKEPFLHVLHYFFPILH